LIGASGAARKTARTLFLAALLKMHRRTLQRILAKRSPR
jgi:ActR/RegA family two-component response regulator